MSAHEIFKPRARCPMCYSTKVVDEVDKSKVLYYQADGIKIYAKVKKCKECGYIF